MTNKFKFYLLVFIFLLGICEAQSDSTDTFNYNSKEQTKHFSLVTGAGIQKSFSLDIGFSINEYGRDGYHPFAWAYYFSNEIIFNSKTIYGPKVGAYFAGGQSAMVLGINAIYYTDLSKSQIYIRPEIGIGLLNFRITYGYNFEISSSKLSNISKHNFSFILFFSLKEISKKYVEY